MITVFRAPYLDRISSLKQLEDDEPVVQTKESSFIIPNFDAVSGIKYEKGIPPVYETSDEFIRSDVSKKQDISQIDEIDEDFEPPLSDFLLRLKVMKDAPQIIKKSEEIKYHSGIEYSYAKSILNARLNKISQVLASSPELIVDNGSNKTFSEYEGNNLKRVTKFTNDENGIKIKQIDLINEDSTKDIITIDDNNCISKIQRGYRQIAPNSYLEEGEIVYKNGKVVSFCEEVSFINDGTAKSKILSRKNFYKFGDGLLSIFVPKIDFVGKDYYASDFYTFKNGRINKHYSSLSSENGHKTWKKRITF